MTLPAKDSLSTYGGALRNYLAGITDPTTDRDARAMNVALASVAAGTHTIGRAYVRFRLNDGGAPVLLEHDAVWGEGPSVAPLLSRVEQGHLRITWPVSVVDELGDPHVVVVRAGWAQLRTLGAQRLIATVLPLSTPNVVDVYLSDLAHVLSDGSNQEVDLIVI